MSETNRADEIIHIARDTYKFTEHLFVDWLVDTAKKQAGELYDLDTLLQGYHKTQNEYLYPNLQQVMNAIRDTSTADKPGSISLREARTMVRSVIRHRKIHRDMLQEDADKPHNEWIARLQRISNTIGTLQAEFPAPWQPPLGEVAAAALRLPGTTVTVGVSNLFSLLKTSPKSSTSSTPTNVSSLSRQDPPEPREEASRTGQEASESVQEASEPVQEVSEPGQAAPAPVRRDSTVDNGGDLSMQIALPHYLHNAMEVSERDEQLEREAEKLSKKRVNQRNKRANRKQRERDARLVAAAAATAAAVTAVATTAVNYGWLGWIWRRGSWKK